MSLFLTACGGNGQDQGGGGSDEDAIRIAIAAPMTGDNSEYGIGFANAAELMAEKWNEEGLIEGKKIVIEKYDDKNSPEEGVTVANKIASDGGIPVVIGHFASGVCLAAAPVYQENGIIERSEERRVGKECRSEWARGVERKRLEVGSVSREKSNYH